MRSKFGTLVNVSVVVPCFNCAGTLVRAVESIRLQSLRPAEVILVDDASNDSTHEILFDLRKKYPDWIKVIIIENNIGAAGARNVGWAAASHPLIAFLDSDDAWHPSKIEIQYSYMLAHPDVVLSGHSFKQLAETNTDLNWALDEFTIEVIGKWSLLLSNRFVTPSVMIRNHVPDRFRSQQRHMEDHLLWLEVVFGGGKAVKIVSPLAAIFKPQYGASGLSSQLWAMEKGELGNYKRLYYQRLINYLLYVFLIIYSIVKFLRRLLINVFRK